ncbi:uncharacterized protein LOC112192477 [Rosa chinensis]|uniref:uncharacterized protein LOC112192477 n=1 Tax=Rosa chinensis TaxID=74649 RepID=UPI000D091400|nr:uncharacterized protein LOC112192477 [Rosa chinensis]
MYPELIEQCNLLSYQTKPKNDPYSNTYNPGWRNHPNFGWGGNQNREQGQGYQRQGGGYQGASSSHFNNQGANNAYHAPRPPYQAPSQQPLPLQQPQVPIQEARKTPTFEEMMAAFVNNQAKQDEKINVIQQSVSKLEVQMGQLVHELCQRKQGVFPSQVVNSPRHEAKAITILRSGRQVENNVYMPTNEEVVTPREPPAFERRLKHEQVVLDYNEGQDEVLKNNSNSKANHEKEVSNDHPIDRSFQRGIPFNPPLKIVQEEEVSLPYPQAIWEQEKKLKKESQLREMIDLFKKVHINIPLLEAVKTIPSYAKFLKDMCMKKKKFKEHEQVALCEEVSAIIQRKLPPKLKDLGSFTIPSKIGETTYF